LEGFYRRIAQPSPLAQQLRLLFGEEGATLLLRLLSDAV
jgi:hypothetical protein